MKISIKVEVRNARELQKLIDFIEGYGNSVGCLGCSIEEVDFSSHGQYNAVKTRSALGLSVKKEGK